MSPEHAYQMFLALKLHFTTDYDYFRYNGKTKTNLSAVQYRNDKWNYVKLGKKYGDNLQDFLVANFVEHPEIGSWNIISDETEKTYKKWLKRKESFVYIVGEECSALAVILEQEGKDFNSLFEVKGGQHPTLLKLYFQNQISIDTLLTLAVILGFLPLWDKEIEDDIIWPEISNKLRKYRPFVQLDKSKLKQTIRKSFQ